MNLRTFKTTGYTEDCNGYSVMFSWWRNTIDARFWSICSHTEFGRDCRAVTDDFGNLVKVAA
jgi:hypothetical protein